MPKKDKEEDFEELSLQEIARKLHQVHSEIYHLNQIFVKQKKDGLSMKDKRVKDVLEKIAILGFKERYLDSLRENKIPLKEKIPKTSTFYKHWVSRDFKDQIDREVVEIVNEDVQNLGKVSKGMGVREAANRAREAQNVVLRNRGL